MSMRFRITGVDGFPRSAETVAFGYRAQALVFEQRVRRPLAIRDMRHFINGGRRSRNTNSPARTFVPGSINGRSGFFRGTNTLLI
jgi:hypothetical protein